MKLRKLIIPGVDKPLVVRDAWKIMGAATRRQFLSLGAGFGALTMLTGCEVVDEDSAEDVLRQVSKFNDAVQSWIFNPNKLAPTFSENEITRPFPFNAFYTEEEAPSLDADTYRLEVSGLADNKKSWSLPELYALSEVTQITRHVCVEGWSAIGSWSGTPLSHFLEVIGADRRAKYCWFRCADGYSNTIDMPTALHSQTLMAFKFDQKPLTRAYDFL